MTQADDLLAEALADVHGGYFLFYLPVKTATCRQRERLFFQVNRLYPATLHVEGLGKRVQGHIEELIWLVGERQRLVDISDGGKNSLILNLSQPFLIYKTIKNYTGFGRGKAIGMVLRFFEEINNMYYHHIGQYSFPVLPSVHR
jgi:hypothetical protein